MSLGCTLANRSPSSSNSSSSFRFTLRRFGSRLAESSARLLLRRGEEVCAGVMLGDETRGAFCRCPGRAKPAPGALLYALALVLIVNLRELLPAVGQTKPKTPILSPRLLRQIAARFCLFSINVGGVPCRGLAILRVRHAARRAFESAQIGQSAESLRSSDEFHGLGAALAPQGRRGSIVGNHNGPQILVLRERLSAARRSTKVHQRQKASLAPW